MNDLHETPEERKRRYYIIFFKVAIYTSWFMLALGFSVIVDGILKVFENADSIPGPVRVLRNERNGGLRIVAAPFGPACCGPEMPGVWQ